MTPAMLSSALTPPCSPVARPGLRWGEHPQRPDHTDAPPRTGTLWRQPGWWMHPQGWQRHRLEQAWLTRVQQLAAPLLAPDVREETCQQAIVAAARELRRHGFQPEPCAQAMACVQAALQRASGRQLHPLQMLACSHLLDHQLVEMATGEGKTLSMAAAACIAALAGVPVHVVTANDYLAERDAQALSSLCKQLGLSAGHVGTSATPAQRRQIYRCDIVFTTARELAFDHLRDGLALPGSGHEQPVLQGLCMALLDEADSILLDEAVVPLVISASLPERPAQQAARRALWWQARQVAAALVSPAHFITQSGTLAVTLTPQGEADLQTRTQALGGPWRRPAVRHELVRLALTAQHLLQRDHHYLVREQRVELLDQVTGRVATGRVWSQGLQALVELKEGCPASAPTDTLAQITYQRFFRRYWHLAGLSGTLQEASRELLAVYGLRLRRMPLRLPSKRHDGPMRCFSDAEARWGSVTQRTAALRAQQRPVLIGTDTVSDSERLSWHLQQHGVPHTVLNARHDQHEAEIVAQAGHAGMVTVATRMAGRGTDIALDSNALAAGGLHVIHCQRNESRRMDRQLLGRAARQGQPGSTETWICSSNLSERHTLGAPMLGSFVTDFVPWMTSWWRYATMRLSQRIEEQRQSAMRRHLLKQDQQWEVHAQRARR